jgi:molybdopterin-guanine dinucleotide biosynthesis protein A
MARIVGTMQRVAGFIAAGGLSSRMGRDKAWLDLGGRPMISHVIDAVRQVAPDLAILGNSPRYAELGLPVYADSQPGVGPLEAIRTALANTTSLALIVACDLPMVTPPLFEFLLSISEPGKAVVPVGPDAKLETLCAVYPRSALEPVTRLIDSGERMIRRLFELVELREVAFSELSHLAGAEHFFDNVNSPDDYARVMEITNLSRDKRPDRL